jgi:hypothetical protein
MKKRYKTPEVLIFILITFLSSLNSIGFSQNIQTNVITGKVLDSLTNEPVFLTKIYLYKNEEIIYSCLSDTAGIFNLPLNNIDTNSKYNLIFQNYTQGYSETSILLSDFLITKTINLSLNKGLENENKNQIKVIECGRPLLQDEHNQDWIQFRCPRIRRKEDIKTPENSIKSMEISGFVLDSLEENEYKHTFIDGYVLDSITKVGIYAVKVKFMFQNNLIAIASTDFNGYFRMRTIEFRNSNENYSLIFSQTLDGYKEIQISLSDCLKLNNGRISEYKKEKRIESVAIMSNAIDRSKRKWYQFWKK